MAREDRSVIEEQLVDDLATSWERLGSEIPVIQLPGPAAPGFRVGAPVPTPRAIAWSDLKPFWGRMASEAARAFFGGLAAIYGDRLRDFLARNAESLRAVIPAEDYALLDEIFHLIVPHRAPPRPES